MSQSTPTPYRTTTSLPPGTHTAIDALTDKADTHTTTYTESDTATGNISLACLNDNAVLTYDNTGKLIGVLTYRTDTDDTSTLEISSLTIAPEHYRSGVLPDLLNTIKDRVSQRYKKFVIECSTTERPLIRTLYASGFTKSEVIKADPANTHKYECRIDAPHLTVT